MMGGYSMKPSEKRKLQQKLARLRREAADRELLEQDRREDEQLDLARSDEA